MSERASQFRRLVREVRKQISAARAVQLEKHAGPAARAAAYKAAHTAHTAPAAQQTPHQPPRLARVSDLEARHVPEIETFLFNQRRFKELLAQYAGPSPDSKERVRLSARRVGLDVEHLDK